MSLNDYTAWLQPYLLNNQVMQNFRELGYKIITLKNIFSFINFPNSDIVYDFDSLSSPLQKLEAYNFQYMFLRTTMVRVLIEEEELSPDKFKKLPVQILELINPRFTQENYFYNKFFLQNLYQLDSLENIYQIPGKKFLYAHLMAIHAPFTFTTSGEMRLNTAETKQGYADQVTYVNKRILAIVKNILANSKTPPIIILQGDHGYSLHFTKGEAVFRILNAYYLPQGGKDKLYPTITPVNTFRLIFSYYFNQDYAPLPDQSIWINAAFPGGYKIAPQTCVH
jgi:hypothetical protein